jgi:hypothetical protein
MIVTKEGAPKNHNWQPTQRKIPGALLKLHACTIHKPAHVKAYYMEITGCLSLDNKLYRRIMPYIT